MGKIKHDNKVAERKVALVLEEQDKFQLKYDEVNRMLGEKDEMLGDLQHKVKTDQAWQKKQLNLLKEQAKAEAESKALLKEQARLAAMPPFIKQLDDFARGITSVIKPEHLPGLKASGGPMFYEMMKRQHAAL